MIGRIDDYAKFSFDNLMRNFQHDKYSILVRQCWSKNVHTEADVLDQVLLGVLDPHNCVLLGLATWIKYSIGSYSTENKFVSITGVVNNLW